MYMCVRNTLSNDFSLHTTMIRNASEYQLYKSFYEINNLPYVSPILMKADNENISIYSTVYIKNKEERAQVHKTYSNPILIIFASVTVF